MAVSMVIIRQDLHKTDNYAISLFCKTKPTQRNSAFSKKTSLRTKTNVFSHVGTYGNFYRFYSTKNK